MQDQKEMLEVVNENDEVIGLERRDTIHREGLIHRETNIIFITPQGEAVFQHRSKAKDTYPDKLSSCVGGHVDPGMSYEETAIRECKEETGLAVSLDDLVFLGKLRKQTFDESTGLTNNVFRAYYAYLFKGDIGELRVEPGKSEGFEAWDIDALASLPPELSERFSPSLLSEAYIELYQKAKKALHVT